MTSWTNLVLHIPSGFFSEISYILHLKPGIPLCLYVLFYHTGCTYLHCYSLIFRDGDPCCTRAYSSFFASVVWDTLLPERCTWGSPADWPGEEPPLLVLLYHLYRNIQCEEFNQMQFFLKRSLSPIPTSLSLMFSFLLVPKSLFSDNLYKAWINVSDFEFAGETVPSCIWCWSVVQCSHLISSKQYCNHSLSLSLSLKTND